MTIKYWPLNGILPKDNKIKDMDKNFLFLSKY